jgi:hypothetical protein
MKSQARLRLRQTGKHHRTDSVRPWPRWTYNLGVQHNLAHAFEMNVWPRHYADDEPPEAYWQMPNYLTGHAHWRGPVRLHVAQ